MDINSVEFYTIAFVVAMALIALLIGRTEKKPPSTYIAQLATEAASGEDDDIVRLEPVEGGRVCIRRSGLMLGPEETINLVITIQEDHCTIVEKKGLKRRRAVGEPVTGEATLKCLRPGRKYRIRYESQITSAWASFTFDTTNPTPITVSLKY
jgi:hypothetical protein